MARLPQLFDYEVEGAGRFPFDMLRYDQCWPQTSSDAEHMSADWDTARRMVAMRSIHPATVARWNSFGWTVIQTEAA